MRPGGLLLLAVLTSSCGAEWTEKGPDLGGRLSAIVASPSDPDTLLVASPGGGIWRTRDGGTSWHEPGNYSLADFSVVHLEWDRIRPGRLYASTYSDLYASTDLGDRWTNLTRRGGVPSPFLPLGRPEEPKPFAQLRYSSTAGTVFWSRPCAGLYYSYDGTTFTQHWPFAGGASNPDNCVLAIAADDATGRVYFSTMNEDFSPARLFRSTCAWTAAAPCLSWESANTGLPTRAYVNDIAWGGTAHRFAVSVNGLSTQVYTSVDGTTWQPALSQPPTPNWTPRPLVSPAPGQLLFGTVLAYHSPDWGQSWSNFTIPYLHPDIRAIHWASYASGGRLWVTTDGRMSGSYVNIARWSFTPGSAPTGGTAVGADGLKVWQAYFMAATGNPGAPRTRRRIFLGSLDNGALCSDDGGGTWVTGGTPPGGGCGDHASVVFAPSNPNRAYSRTCSGSEFGRTDNALSAASCSGVTWTTLSPAAGHSMPRLWTRAMTAVDPRSADRVVFARFLDVGISPDGGANWTYSTLPGGARPVSVYVSSTGLIVAGTLGSGAYSSADNGATWLPFGLSSPAPDAVLGIAHSTAGGREGTWFLATTGGLYRKLPGGTFTRQTVPGYVVSDVEVDPTCPTRVYAALGYAGPLGQHRGGVQRSIDNGATFQSLTAGLDIHQAPVADIQVDPVSPRYLHAAVFGRGAWTYDSGSTSCP